MEKFKIYSKDSKPTAQEKETIVQFLFNHLEEFGDEKAAILKCLNFAVKDSENGLGY